MRTDVPAASDGPPDAPPVAPSGAPFVAQPVALPPDVGQRLRYWHGLWTRSALYHYLFGVVSVAASVISTSVEGNLAKVFSIIAAIATALIGFMHPERRYMKFVRAWRVLDVAAMRYQHGLIDKAALVDAVARGEGLIADFEDKDDQAGDPGRQRQAGAASALSPKAPNALNAASAPTAPATPAAG